MTVWFEGRNNKLNNSRHCTPRALPQDGYAILQGASAAKQSPATCTGTSDVLLHIKDYVMDIQPAVYLLTNKPNGTLYTGVTSDLRKRIWQHKQKVTKGFCARYNLTRLIYFEIFEDMYQTISREKQLKAGSRKSKIKLIESTNPDWRDLYTDICA